MVAAEVLSALPLDLPADAIDIPGTATVGRGIAPETGEGGSSFAQPPVHASSEPATRATVSPAAPSTHDSAAAAESDIVAARLRDLLTDVLDLDAFSLDTRLRQVVRLEQQLDAELGSWLAVAARGAVHRVAGFRSFETYVRERLGLAPRKVRALLRLERVCERYPAFARAYREGTLSWVQAHALILVLLIGHGGHARAWIERATQVSVRRLRDDVDRALLLHETDPDTFSATGGRPADPGDASECAEASSRDGRQIGAKPRLSGEDASLFVHGPASVVRLVRAVICTVRRAIERQKGYLPTEGEAFDAMLEHALATWGDNAVVRRAHRVFARDGWRCTAPGCSSQQNLHDHHVVFRSAGGSNDLSNRTTLCAWHHLRGVHAGTVRCRGTAPDALRFDLGVRRGRRPLISFAPGERLSERGQPTPLPPPAAAA
jgi:5-methylcytosine-specific restriction endonuclease McrA